MKKNKIKVCFVLFGMYPLFNVQISKKFKGIHGGAEVQVFQIAKKLSEDSSFSVSCVVGNFGQSAIEYYGKIKIIRSGGLYGDHMNLNQKEHLGRVIVKRFRKWIRFTLFVFLLVYEWPGVIVTRCAGARTGYVKFFSKFINAKTVYMVAHEMDCSGEYERGNGIYGKLYRYGLTRADLIIAQNEEQQKMLIDNYQIKSVILPSVYDIEEIDNKNYNGFVLWVGRCEGWKQPEVFIELVKQNPQEDFVMITLPAEGKGEYYEKIKNSCYKIPNLIFLPSMPFGEINKYFLEAKLFVITSCYEGFPNTLIQAAKNKTPIISLTVNPNNIFGRFNIGYCANNDRRVFFEKFSEFVSNEELLRQKGEIAYQYAKENHDIDKIIPEFKRIFKNLVSEH